jgi:hypothetical protein
MPTRVNLNKNTDVPRIKLLIDACREESGDVFQIQNGIVNRQGMPKGASEDALLAKLPASTDIHVYHSSVGSGAIIEQHSTRGWMRRINHGPLESLSIGWIKPGKAPF